MQFNKPIKLMFNTKVYFQKALIICLILNIIIILYFSWIPKPNMTSVNWLPGRFAQFLDLMAIKDIRTSFPFITLGLLLNWYKIKFRLYFLKYLLPLFIAIMAETGQVFLPKRVFALADIYWAMAGAILGIFISSLIGKFWIKN